MKYTKEVLAPIVKDSFHWAEVCRKLGVKPFTGSQTYIKKCAVEGGVDFSHFKGAAWSRGKTFQSKVPIESYLTNQKRINSHSLKMRLIKDGIKKTQCEECLLTQWLGQPPVLELDHIDNNHLNNNLENLRILCPNCHAQKTRIARMVKR